MQLGPSEVLLSPSLEIFKPRLDKALRSTSDAKSEPALGRKLDLRAPEIPGSLNYTMVLLVILALQQKFIDCDLVCLFLAGQFHFLGLQLNLHLWR